MESSSIKKLPNLEGLYSHTILPKIIEAGVLPLYFHPNIEVMKSILQICHKAGIGVFEFMNRGENAMDIFSELLDFVTANLGGMSLAVGTVCDADTAQRFIDLGASLIIAPNLNQKVGEVCIKNNVHWIPGIFTPTEIYKARDYGLKLVKLFPSDSLSPNFIRAMKGPAPEIDFIATGGIDPNRYSISKWIRGGASAVGIGSSLFSEYKINSENENLCKTLISCQGIVRNARL